MRTSVATVFTVLTGVLIFAQDPLSPEPDPLTQGRKDRILLTHYRITGPHGPQGRNRTFTPPALTDSWANEPNIYNPRIGTWATSDFVWVYSQSAIDEKILKLIEMQKAADQKLADHSTHVIQAVKKLDEAQKTAASDLLSKLRETASTDPEFRKLLAHELRSLIAKELLADTEFVKDVAHAVKATEKR